MGKGVEPDLVEARRLYERACELHRARGAAASERPIGCSDAKRLQELPATSGAPEGGVSAETVQLLRTLQRVGLAHTRELMAVHHIESLQSAMAAHVELFGHATPPACLADPKACGAEHSAGLDLLDPIHFEPVAG